MHGRISLHASIAASPHPKPKHDDRKIKTRWQKDYNCYIFFHMLRCVERVKNLKTWKVFNTRNNFENRITIFNHNQKKYGQFIPDIKFQETNITFMNYLSLRKYVKSFTWLWHLIYRQIFFFITMHSVVNKIKEKKNCIFYINKQ